MKFRFKIQDYQTQAVTSVVDCFAGQTFINESQPNDTDLFGYFCNADCHLSDAQILNNIKQVQGRQNLPLSEKIISNEQSRINLDVEMETGTGKTYCYIKTIMELNKRYGWRKFIIVVPSIAIREGVYKSFQITAAHFLETYNKSPRFFIYNSKTLHQLRDFSYSSDISVMIINIQAFNARSKDNRRIYEEQDSFHSRRPMDVIAATRPILILDEPQKMGEKTTGSLKEFHPLMILRYSATHSKIHNKVHRLDALDAYNQKLVKKIAVRGLTVKGVEGTQGFLYLDSIRLGKNAAPHAKIEMEIKRKNGVKRVVKGVHYSDNLFEISKGLEQYKGFTVSQIDYLAGKVEFGNGVILTLGEAIGDVTEDDIRRIQIRETIKAHLEKERQLFHQGIKVLSLFFIDKVSKYRDYAREDEKGDYARIFEEEYPRVRDEFLQQMDLEGTSWRDYLQNTDTEQTHAGYFSIDKKSSCLLDPQIEKKGDNAGLSNDIDAYDLILKDKERLLSLKEPVRFIFSHSALREGWDNPNVFTICMLKHSDNNISRRQEVGRGLRLCVNAQGERIDNPDSVHDVNILTIVASESYHDFVDNLQKEISGSLSERPRKANQEYFTGKIIEMADGEKITIDEKMAKTIERWLWRHDYIDDNDAITKLYHTAKKEENLPPLPDDLEPYRLDIITLVDSVFSEVQLSKPDDGRAGKTNPRNDNFYKEEFQALWERINKRAIYRVDFDSDELIKNCVKALNDHLKISKNVFYTRQTGIQKAKITQAQLDVGESFNALERQENKLTDSAISLIKYDLLGKLAEATQLTRKTLATIFGKIEPAIFDGFKQNPEQFIVQASQLINEQKAAIVIERLEYDELSGGYKSDIFTLEQTNKNFTSASTRLKKHIYDYVIADSHIERQFAQDLDISENVVVYAKLPKTFAIPTPIGSYTPDWAVSFQQGTVKHIYFVAETKGNLSSLQLRPIEGKKIDCARKFFDKINARIDGRKVKYGVVKNYEDLIDLAGLKKT